MNASNEFLNLFSPEKRATLEANRRSYAAAFRSLSIELANVGISANGMDDVRRLASVDARAVVPLLLRQLLVLDYEPLQHDIIGTLGEPWALTEFESICDAFEQHAAARPNSAVANSFAGLVGNLAMQVGEAAIDRVIAWVGAERLGLSRLGLIPPLARVARRSPSARAALDRLVVEAPELAAAVRGSLRHGMRDD